MEGGPCCQGPRDSEPSGAGSLSKTHQITNKSSEGHSSGWSQSSQQPCMLVSSNACLLSISCIASEPLDPCRRLWESSPIRARPQNACAWTSEPKSPRPEKLKAAVTARGKSLRHQSTPSRLCRVSLRLPGSRWRGSAGSRSACRYAQPPCNGLCTDCSCICSQ